jgi:hypothetical protein
MKFLFFLILSFPAFALTSGTPVRDMPDLVRIHFSNGWVCSGIYLDPETILTAAHCLDLHSHVTKIENKNVLPVKVTKLHPIPGYDQSAWHSNDVGLIKTTENKEFRGDFKLPDGEVRSGLATLFGAGRSGVGKDYARLSSENGFLKLGSILFFTSGNACVAPNDSGGPVIQGNVIVGIMATSMVRPCISTATAIYPHRHFIRKNLRK